MSPQEPHESAEKEPAKGKPEPARIYMPSIHGDLRQGEIISDLPELRLNLDRFVSTGEAVLDIETHPYAIVVSQDCDLMQDYDARQGKDVAADKLLPNILFCEATTAALLRGRSDINKDVWRRAVTNKNERYQVLEAVPSELDALGVGLPALGVDFKRYFSLPREEAYHRVSAEASRRCRLINPYLEHFCTRFFYFQYRVALPADHQIVL